MIILKIYYDFYYIYVYEEKLKTSNPNRKGRFIEKQSRHKNFYIFLHFLCIHLYLTSLI